MRHRDGLLGLTQDARPRVALRQMHGLGQRLAQQAALALAIGPIAGGAERLTCLPSVSIMATSTPSSEVPLIRPSAVNIIAVMPWRRPALDVTIWFEVPELVPIGHIL